MTEIVSPGKHLILDFWGVERNYNVTEIERSLRAAALVCGATVLNVDLHEFGEGAGVTGVAVLAESHISIHTWPELSYVALDVFMCGSCDPEKCIGVFEKAFMPEDTKVTLINRGRR
jgi:S-adenosylmethionine decarboxylase